MTIHNHNRQIQMTVKFLITVSLVLLVSGCLNRKRGINRQASANMSNRNMTNQNQPAQPAPASNDLRFQKQSDGSKSVVESAMELSKKYATVTEENANLKMTIRDTSFENNQLKQQLSDTQKELAETKKELDESYQLMIQMRTELNNWKVDILGYRDEMRQAQAAQLSATLQIIELLGGQAEDEPAIDLNNQKITEPNSAKTLQE